MHSKKAQNLRTVIRKFGVLGILVCGIFMSVHVFSGRSEKSVIRHQNIAEHWRRGVQIDGCLIGMENWQKGVEKTYDFQEGCVLATPLFQGFIHGEPDVVIPFLLAKLPSEQPTEIHVCPHQVATEGEFAWYLLQHIAHRNWYEYQGENPLINEQIATRQAVLAQEAPYSPMTTDQQLLRNILKNPDAQHALRSWYVEYSSVSSSNRSETS